MCYQLLGADVVVVQIHFLLTHNCVVSMHCATHSTLAKQLTVIWETGNKMKICNLRSEFQSLHEYESRH